MNYLQPLWLVFTIVSFSAANSCKKVCVLDNKECVTSGGSNVYNAVVNGSDGLVKPLDPYEEEDIHVKLESAKYELTNITLFGLKKCKLTQLFLNVTARSYDQYMHCPKLKATYDFKAKESPSSNSVEFSRKGVATAIAYNSETLITGKYGVLVTEKDHYPHFYVLTNSSNTLFNGTTDENSSGELILSIIIRRAMIAVMNGIDTVIRVREMGETFPEKK